MAHARSIVRTVLPWSILGEWWDSCSRCLTYTGLHTLVACEDNHFLLSDQVPKRFNAVANAKPSSSNMTVSSSSRLISLWSALASQLHWNNPRYTCTKPWKFTSAGRRILVCNSPIMSLKDAFKIGRHSFEPCWNGNSSRANNVGIAPEQLIRCRLESSSHTFTSCLEESLSPKHFPRRRSAQVSCFQCYGLQRHQSDSCTGQARLQELYSTDRKVQACIQRAYIQKDERR